MSAGMHDARDFGLIWKVIFFFDRESVDIRAERDARAGFLTFDDSDRAGSGDAVHQRNSQGVQSVADVVGGVCFLEGELRVAV